MPSLNYLPIPKEFKEEHSVYALSGFSVVTIDNRIYLEWGDTVERVTECQLITTKQAVRDADYSGFHIRSMFYETVEKLNAFFLHKRNYEGRTVDGESYKEALEDLAIYFGL